MLATCARFQMSEGEVELILTNQMATIPYPDDVVDVRLAKTALVREAAMLLPLANVTEGGYSVSWNVEAFKLWYRQACAELGMEDILTKPTCRNRSNLW